MQYLCSSFLILALAIPQLIFSQAAPQQPDTVDTLKSQALKVYLEREPGGTVFDASQGDGGASLPGVSRELLDAAHKMQIEHGTGYDKPFGTPAYRRAVVEDYWGLDAATGWGPTNVVACQGGRDALVKAYDAVQFLGHGRHGDFVVVSRVPWISYNWGPYSVGALVYARNWPDPWPGRFGHHEIWHLFVIAGAGAHYAFQHTLVDLPYAPL